MNRSILSLLVVIVLVLTATSGCIFQEEKKVEEQKYVLEAVINVDKSVIYPNETVTFDASGSKGNILEYYWDFNVSGEIDWVLGDKVMAYSYTDCGVYKIALKVDDKKGDPKTDYTFVYVNYHNATSDTINKGDKNPHYFPVKSSAKKAIIKLTYDYTHIKPQPENLDLSILAKYNESYEYVKSSNNTNDNGGEIVEILHNDIRFHEPGDWCAEVYYNITSLAFHEITYNLEIEVHYEL